LNKTPTASLLLIHLNVATKIHFLRMVYPSITLLSLKLLLLKHQPSIKLLLNKTPKASLLFIYMNVAATFYKYKVFNPPNNYDIPKIAFAQSPAIHKIAL
jgi:hypothetical protein